MRANRSQLCLSVLFAMLALGCGGDDPPDTGVLVVPYELGNGRSCEELGIVSVRAELDGGDYAEEMDCDTGEVRFALLEPGRYEVSLYGLDEDGVPVMDSLAVGPQTIHVVGGGTTVVFDPPAQLTAAPAKIRLRWEFGFSSCEASGIDHFAVAAWRADGSELLMTSEVACDMPGEGRGQYRLVPDVEREVSGDELGEVEVQPYDMHMLPLGDPAVFGFDPPGAGREVELSLSCDAGGCDSSGLPD
jgi:hypothetical protein